MKNKFWSYIFPPAKWPVEEAKKPVVKYERKLSKSSLMEYALWGVAFCIMGCLGWLMTRGH